MQFDEDWLAEPGFTWKAGYALASCCKLAYADTDEARRILGTVWGLHAHIFSAGETQGFVAWGDRAVVAAFRGTQGLADWFGNLDVVSAPSDALRGRVHRGFLQAYGDAAHLVADALGQAPGRRLWFTGHSLGGALAVIGAGTHVDLAPAGLVTFGQPRMLKRDAARFVTDTFGDNYARVVNDNDIVARIPPRYRHTGNLLHFDFEGELKPGSALEADDGMGEDAPAPLSEAEFEALQDAARRFERAEAAEAVEWDGLEGATRGDADVAIEGVVPGVSAHRIDNYVHLMRSRAGVETGRTGRAAIAAVSSRSVTDEAGMEMAGVFHAETGDARQPVLLKLTRPDWTPPATLRVQSRFGLFATAMATADNIRELEADPAVAAIEASRDAGIEDLDTTVPFVGAADIHRPPTDERGDSAIVGVIDTGVDVLHKAFRNAAGDSRILAIWDQRDAHGPSPADVDPAFSQNYGRLWLKPEIDALIASHDPADPATPDRLRDLAGHGTHVAGIAAGRATGNMADGMAPEAWLIGVVANITSGPGEPPSIGYSMAHVDGLAFLRRAAQGGTPVIADGLPIAINVSLGMNAGAHDGTTTLEAAFDSITGGGRDPGAVIVKSAGNERGHAGHARVSAIQDGTAELFWSSSARFRQEDYFEAWFNGLDDFAFRLADPAGNETDVVSFDAPEVESTLGGNAVRLDLTKRHPDNGDHRLTITIRSSPDMIQPGDWRLDIIGRKVQSPDADVHVWVERARARAIRFATQDPEMTISIPGTARTVIAVGACNASVPFRLNPSSSWGLTRSGLLKPELCAPGFDVRSAASAEDDLSATTIKSGTSMAAPHVTGALALVLSRLKKDGGPMLNAVQLQSALISTIRGDVTRHHVGAGYGILDAGKLFGELT